ncbi:MAG: carbohydrate porin [Pseudanabaena sp. M135S2SP2A07QC]|nr:carbohydrate porin [Pseudanabaena sp. M090S1SP2A07QC]MCA6507297.1 carbohydrate porin [Pseudanabaena sp. M172S2SP2A07QC]MCA6520732.1 carbohydrate porin [Pseudanabaena sp. M051S1SP2A07QC]MCA6528465.1 carbohydrate porin [Pseudanabaena sp. M125S2SP2A07QC]MCA6535485.1 carbohydrate porin [Pseudanabaena sp. M176S2SP2A07QC]MCA6538605.1 carbohydrate porin [Pseudanabaena sp. M037S2SP2A07QC]MCA6544595.1 carbohydrate porin [Pseudanabaena sp. M074S1SP2A07QC]MCA6548784.1 carbohydrate porin [Pseudanabae
MSKFSKKNYSLVVSAAVAASTLIAGAANAQASKDSEVVRSVGADTLVEQVQLRPSAVAQNVTSVSQLSDVRPTDWAFTALQSLVERYGCIAGFPDRTFRGKQATSRYEFAAGLNACLDKINEIISAGLADKVSKQDLATLQKLQEEFAAELATLRGRVDALDAKTAKLEAQQFSTTTKLRGEAIFGLVGGSDGVTTATNPSSTNVVFNYRARLNFDTSFTGKDLLRTRLQASNTGSFNNLAASNSTRLSYDGVSAANTNVFELNRLFYRFPVGDNITAYIAPIGAPEDVISPLNPLESDSQGTISRFGRFNPLIRIASSGGASGLAVAGLNFKFSDKVSLEVAYSASNAAAATGQGGVTGGDTKIAAQFVFKPADVLTLGVGYANAYTVGNSLGSGLNVDSIGASAADAAGISGIRSNTVVGSLIWDITKKFTFNTWGAWTFADTTGATTASTTFTSWMAALSGKDLFTEGDLAAVMFGQPLFRSSVGGVATGSTDTPYHLEALYRFRVSKNISITPGVYFVFNQNSANANGTATVGVIRTTFSF